MAQCICSHSDIEHVDKAGRCQEPTGRCECAVYSELCPQCTHGYYSHNGTNGVCTRVVQKTRMLCSCTHYPTEMEGN